MNRLSIGLTAVALGAAVSACGNAPLASQPPATVSATVPAPPASSADVTLSCAPVDDRAPSGALTSDLYPEVTMTTRDFVAATSVDVTVIGFSVGGLQLGTRVLVLGGPFAPGQTFTADSTDMGNMGTCEIASVAADGARLTYANESPVSR